MLCQVNPAQESPLNGQRHDPVKYSNRKIIFMRSQLFIQSPSDYFLVLFLLYFCTFVDPYMIWADLTCEIHLLNMSYPWYRVMSIKIFSYLSRPPHLLKTFSVLLKSFTNRTCGVWVKYNKGKVKNWYT